MHFRIVVPAILLLALGCGLLKDTTPDDVVFDPAPPPMIVGRTAQRVEGHVVNKARQHLPLPVAYDASPGGVADVSGSGILKCRATGDVTVRASYGTYSEEAQVKCRIVESIRGPGNVEVTVGSKQRATYSAVSELGTVLTDVPVSVAVADPGTARWSEGSIVGMRAGNTQLNLTAGDAMGSTGVAVWDRLKVSVRLDSSKPNGDTWDSAFSGSTAPEPYVKVNGRTYMMEAGEPDCRDAYRCEATVLTQEPDGKLSVEVWDDDFSDDDYAGETACTRARECPTGQGAMVVVE
jgi:hypothetical protein